MTRRRDLLIAAVGACVLASGYARRSVAREGTPPPEAERTASAATHTPGLSRNGRRVPLLAFYYPWYATEFGPSGAWAKWGKKKPGPLAPRGTDPRRVLSGSTLPVRMRDIASTAYPLIGPYDSREREVVRWHVRLAKAAGIDGFLVSWWGPGNWQDIPGQTYRAFTEVLLPVAEEEGFKVCLCDELPQFFVRRTAQGPAHLSSIQNGFDKVVDWAAEYLDRFRRSPAYLHIDGQPVYYVYQVWQGKMSPDECRRLVRTVEARVGPVFWIVDKMRCRLAKDSPRNRELYFPDEWLDIPEIDCLGGYATFCNMRVHEYGDLRVLFERLVKQGHAHGKKVLLPVHPGLDNSKFNEKPYVIPRDSGETFRGFIRAALEAEADILAVTSFNEWPETTVVEPAMTWPDPYLYLKIIAGRTGAEWRGPPLPPASVLDPLVIPMLVRPPPHERRE